MQESNFENIVFGKNEGSVKREYEVEKTQRINKGGESKKWFVNVKFGDRSVRMLMRDFNLRINKEAVEISI